MGYTYSTNLVALHSTYQKLLQELCFPHFWPCDLENYVKVTHHQTCTRPWYKYGGPPLKIAKVIEGTVSGAPFLEGVYESCIFQFFSSVTLKNRSRSLIMEHMEDIHDVHLWYKFNGPALNFWKDIASIVFFTFLALWPWKIGQGHSSFNSSKTSMGYTCGTNLVSLHSTYWENCVFSIFFAWWPWK